MRASPFVIRAWILAVAVCVSSAASAQSTTLVASVAEAGSGTPLVDAEVLLPELHRIARTDWLGVAILGGVPSGLHRVRVRKLGYAAADLDLLFHDDTIGPVFMLSAEPPMLDTVRVIAVKVPLRLEPFEHRMKMGIGRFVTDAALARDGDRDLAYVVMTRFPGLTLATEADGTPHIVSPRMQCSMMQCGRCDVRVMLDDAPIPGDDFNLIRVWDLAGMEYYSGETMPVRYRVAGSECGLLLLWSK